MKITSKDGLKFHNLCTATLRNAITNEIVQQEKAYNTVVNVGIRLLMDRLGGEVGTIFNPITYGAVGTDSTAESTAQTNLIAELARAESSYARSGNTATFSVFFNTGEANGTIWEVGFFGGDATSMTNSGVMFDRVKLAASITKTSSYTLTVEVDVLATDT